MIRIAIVSDHTLAGSGIAALLREGTVYSVADPVALSDWRSLLPGELPDVLLLVSRQRGRLAGEIISKLRPAAPESRIVFISLVEDDEALLSALRVGVEGAMDCHADAAMLVQCVTDVAAGEIVISRDVARRLMADYAAQSPAGARTAAHASLTPREVIVLRLIATGESNKAIAHHLSISQHTVRAHVRSIMRKLEVNNRVQAAAVALRSGLAAS